MPINIPDGLPAKKILQQERIFALEEEGRQPPGDPPPQGGDLEPHAHQD